MATGAGSAAFGRANELAVQEVRCIARGAKKLSAAQEYDAAAEQYDAAVAAEPGNAAFLLHRGINQLKRQRFAGDSWPLCALAHLRDRSSSLARVRGASADA